MTSRRLALGSGCERPETTKSLGIAPLDLLAAADVTADFLTSQIRPNQSSSDREILSSNNCSPATMPAPQPDPPAPPFQRGEFIGRSSRLSNPTGETSHELLRIADQSLGGPAADREEATTQRSTTRGFLPGQPRSEVKVCCLAEEALDLRPAASEFCLSDLARMADGSVSDISYRVESCGEISRYRSRLPQDTSSISS